MKKLIGMTTVMIVFLVLMLGPSVEVYRENPQDYSWIDVNGEFKTSSYDITVSYNLDTPLDEFNGYSLKEVFFDNDQIKDTSKFNNWYFVYADYTVEEPNNVSWLPNANISRYERSIGASIGDKIYMGVNIKTLNTNLYFGGRRSAGRVNFSGTGEFEYISQYESNFFTDKDYPRVQVNQTSNFEYIFIKNFYYINLTDLGINQTKEEMDYWYSKYQSLQENELENYKLLGGEVESQWTRFNTEYLQPILNITALYIDLLIDPLGFVSDLFENIVIIPTIG